jgi:hypothetical protein
LLILSFTDYYEGFFEKVHPEIKKIQAGNRNVPGGNPPLGEIPGRFG